MTVQRRIRSRAQFFIFILVTPLTPIHSYTPDHQRVIKFNFMTPKTPDQNEVAPL